MRRAIVVLARFGRFDLDWLRQYTLLVDHKSHFC